MASGKELLLKDKLHVPDIRKNLVLSLLFVKHEFRLVFESDKFVISKNRQFLEKIYIEKELLKINVYTVMM